MLPAGARFKPNTEAIAAKVMDGEAIMIDLATGAYYSLDDVGSALWEMIEGAASLGEMAAMLTRTYEVSPTQAEADLQEFVARLLEGRLVTPAADPASTPRRDRPRPRARLPYRAPEMTRYDDMRDLLALDPPPPLLDPGPRPTTTNP